MNTSNLKYVLTRNKETNYHIGGVFNIDNFVSYYDTRKYYIVNTISDASKMGHWVAFIFLKHNRKLLFIDSLGKPASFYGGRIYSYYINYLGEKSELVKYQLQHSTSLLCGAYVFFFLFHVRAGVPESKLLARFSKVNRKFNDCIVERFLMKKQRSMTHCVNISCLHKMFKTKCVRKCLCVSNR